MIITDLSFGKKLGGAFGIVLLLLVVVTIMSYSTIRNIALQAHETEKANELVLMLEANLVDHLDWINTLDRFLANPQGKKLKLETDGHRCQLGRWLYEGDRQQAAEIFPKMATLFAGLEKPHSRLHASTAKIGDLFMDEGDMGAAKRKAIEVYQADTQPALKEFRGHMHTIQSQLLKMASERKTRLKKKAEAFTRNVVMTAAIAIALALFFSMAMTRYVAGRTGRLMGFAKTIAQGDFTATMDNQGNDELGRLAEALNEMRVRLGRLMNDYVDGVTHLSASSHELFGISKEMADGSVNMSESSFTVAAAADEMSGNMNSVAVASEQASTNINLVATAAEELNSTVSEIAKSSENARSITQEAVSTANNASTRVNELGAAASQISKVTEVITEISEQTNLLALNATIEAARAGEAGKGFAVVANEIKELAKQTANATQDIKSEIEGIQNTTQSTVNDINQITEVINRVNSIVATIASAVEEQSATTQEIANNVSQASLGIQEVNVNVSQSSSVSSEIARDITVVSQVARDISTSSATVSSNAGDLSGFTSNLKEKMGDFRLPANWGSMAGNAQDHREASHTPDLIQWNDSIKLDVKTFDDQHRTLVGLINKLHRSMKTGKAAQTVAQILDEVAAYTVDHFKAEEEAMRQNGYPDLAEHKAQHQSLIAHVVDAQEKLASSNAMLSLDVMDFLKDWLVNHIQGTDREYAPFFKEKGFR